MIDAIGLTMVQFIMLQNERFRMRTLKVEEERSGRSRIIMKRKMLTKDPKRVKKSWDTTRTDVLISSIACLVLSYKLRTAEMRAEQQLCRCFSSFVTEFIQGLETVPVLQTLFGLESGNSNSET